MKFPQFNSRSRTMLAKTIQILMLLAGLRKCKIASLRAQTIPRTASADLEGILKESKKPNEKGKVFKTVCKAGLRQWFRLSPFRKGKDALSPYFPGCKGHKSARRESLAIALLLWPHSRPRPFPIPRDKTIKPTSLKSFALSFISAMCKTTRSISTLQDLSALVNIINFK